MPLARNVDVQVLIPGAVGEQVSISIVPLASYFHFQTYRSSYWVDVYLFKAFIDIPRQTQLFRV